MTSEMSESASDNAFQVLLNPSPVLGVARSRPVTRSARTSAYPDLDVDEALRRINLE